MPTRSPLQFINDAPWGSSQMLGCPHQVIQRDVRYRFPSVLPKRNASLIHVQFTVSRPVAFEGRGEPSSGIRCAVNFGSLRRRNLKNPWSASTGARASRCFGLTLVDLPLLRMGRLSLGSTVFVFESLVRTRRPDSDINPPPVVAQLATKLRFLSSPTDAPIS
jgi:hypothetical protein